MAVTLSDETTFTPVPSDQCALAKALEAIGDKWSLYVLREAFYGVRRFDQMQHDTGMPRTVLSARLARLCASGLLEKTPYKEQGRRRRHEYRLTSRGLALMVAFAALMEWGETLMTPPRRPPVAFSDSLSGEPLFVRFVSAKGSVINDVTRVRAKVLKETPMRG